VGKRDSARSAARIDAAWDLRSDVQVRPVDQRIAFTFGAKRAELLERGRVVGAVDLFIAATVLEFNFTVVLHEVKHFQDVPGLRIEDGLAP
jgi:tRNA(fMet)-specific endonuclease VapC